MAQANSIQTIAVNIPTNIALSITHEQFVQLALANRELQLELTATGKLIIMPPTGGETGKRNAEIEGQLWLWNRQRNNGIVFNSSTGFLLPNGSIRSPDAAWVRLDKWQALAPEQRENFLPLCPDFVVELRSKNDNMPKLRDKMKEYLDNGVCLGWLIDSKNKKVEIYRLGKQVEVLENPASLSGEEVLPGFILDLTEVWR